jgi:hypothetical protein
MFARLHRGRDYTGMGDALPLKFRDIRDAADRCICDLPKPAIENLFEAMDDTLLDWRERNGRRVDNSPSGN